MIDYEKVHWSLLNWLLQSMMMWTNPQHGSNVYDFNHKKTQWQEQVCWMPFISRQKHYASSILLRWIHPSSLDVEQLTCVFLSHMYRQSRFAETSTLLHTLVLNRQTKANMHNNYCWQCEWKNSTRLFRELQQLTIDSCCQGGLGSGRGQPVIAARAAVAAYPGVEDVCCACCVCSLISHTELACCAGLDEAILCRWLELELLRLFFVRTGTAVWDGEAVLMESLLLDLLKTVCSEQKRECNQSAPKNQQQNISQAMQFTIDCITTASPLSPHTPLYTISCTYVMPLGTI